MDETTTPVPQKNGSMKMVLGIIIVLVIVVIAVVMMNSRTQQTATGPADDASLPLAEESANVADSSTTESTGSAMEDSTVKTFEMEAGSFYYAPKEIRVKKGDKVKIVMNSVDMMHDFNIDELNVKIPVTKSGETNTVEFTADTAGEFEFYCSVGQHRANGQVGTLIVEE